MNIIITDGKLKQLYLAEKQSSYAIARELGCSQSLVMKRLREYAIKTRTIQESKALTKPKYPRISFTENLEEKAYLIGFRLGDLYVSKTHPRSPTIRISTNSTRPEQLKLVHNLFSPYGHVKQTDVDKNGASCIRCYVNTSFSFLLQKRRSIEPWILKNRKYFLEFLGGYIDAEGSFINKRNKVFSLQTQDKRILKQISVSLNGIGIRCGKPKRSRKMGSIIAGVRSNKDVWMIYIYCKKELIKFIECVKDSLRHEKRKKDAIMLLNSLKNVGA